MAQTSRLVLPAILIANDLLTGEVLVRTREGWSPDPREAEIASDDAAAARLQAEAAAAMATQRVVDAYLVDVSLTDAGVPVPNHFRERFKTQGPSHRPDLGKQATYPAG